MAQTIATFKDNLERKLHGQTLSRLQNIYSLIGEAAGNVLSRIDPRETRRIANLSNTIHDDVYNYALPSDHKKTVDIRPQVNRNESDAFRQKLVVEFDQLKEAETFQIRHNNGTKSIRISTETSKSPTTIHSMNSTTGNGTWSVVGSATGLTTNSLYYLSGNKSIEFDSAATGDGIQNTDMSSVNLTTADEVGAFFLWFYVDSTSNLTSCTLTWGNDLTTNYWTGVAQTAQADGTAFRAGWNLVRFEWNAATETGTVDPSAIDSLKVVFATTGAINNIRVDNIISSIGQIYEMEYYSKYLFQNSSGTWIETPTADTDTINLDTDSYNILLYEAGYLAGQELKGEDGQFDTEFFKKELHGEGDKPGLYKQYMANYPQEAILPEATYYEMPEQRVK